MSKRKSPADSQEPKKKKSHWSLGLLDSVKDPNYFLKSDDLVHVIKDKYPKAQHHYLIIPKENISNLKSVTSNHLKLLEHMEEVAKELTENHEKSTFKIGYHAIPSMTRLHLHVISDDMNSDCLKTKKHWNSFTTDFFIKSEDVRANVAENGKVLLPSRETCSKLMSTPLKCHKCAASPKNMPELKKHIITHSNK